MSFDMYGKYDMSVIHDDQWHGDCTSEPEYHITACRPFPNYYHPGCGWSAVQMKNNEQANMRGKGERRMKAKEAVEWLVAMKDRNDYERKEALDMAISALEKQIPKPVKITTSTIRCGKCNRQLSGIGNIHSERNYCQGCGQAIKWEN